jgi:hypothetical protein
VAENPDDCGFMDIPCHIRTALVEFLTWLVRTAMQPILDAWGSTLLATPDLTANPAVQSIWTTCAVTANALLVLFILIAGFTISARHTLQAQYGAKELLPRIALGAVLLNTSLLFCGRLIEATNGITAAIIGQGVDADTAANALADKLTAAVISGGLLLVLFQLAALVMVIVTLFTFVIRIVALVLLIGMAPVALLCHCLPQSEALAFAWWRAFGCCLGIQLGQALIILATLRVFLTPSGMTIFGVPASQSGLHGLVASLSMLWLLIKLPGWCKLVILGPLGQSRGRGLIGQIVSTVLTIKTLGAATGLLAAGGKTAARTAVGSRAATAARTTTAARTAPKRPRPPRLPRPAPRPRGVAGPVAFTHAPVM